MDLSFGWKWGVHLEDPIKKSHPVPLLQILPSPTFLLDATVESYNRDPSLLPSQKKNHTLKFCVRCNVLQNAASLGFGSRRAQ